MVEKDVALVLISLTLFWCLYCKFEHISHLFSSVPNDDFEQINVCWVRSNMKIYYIHKNEFL